MYLLNLFKNALTYLELKGVFYNGVCSILLLYLWVNDQFHCKRLLINFQHIKCFTKVELF
jgi:hypothetical protein